MKAGMPCGPEEQSLTLVKNMPCKSSVFMVALSTTAARFSPHGKEVSYALRSISQPWYTALRKDDVRDRPLKVPKLKFLRSNLIQDVAACWM